jgi:cobalamin biosynthesis Mg chelatase CobN
LRENEIRLAPPHAPPSKDISEIDISNPTHYEAMAKWMASMTTAMEQGISPEEAEEWTRIHVSEDGNPTTDTAQQQSEPQQASPEPPQQQQSTPTSDEYVEPEAPAPKGEVPAEGIPWGVVAAVAAVFVLAAVWFLRRRSIRRSSQ